MPTTIVTIDPASPEHLLIGVADIVYQDIGDGETSVYIHRIRSIGEHSHPGITQRRSLDWLVGRSETVIRLIETDGHVVIDVVKDGLGHIKAATADLRVEAERAARRRAA